MAENRGLEWTFDTAVPVYDKMRPGYSEELYKAIFSYIPIGRESRAIEIGIGSGQATGPMLQTGCRLTAVEYGQRLSEMCREKFKAYDGFSIINDRFENAGFQDEGYDLVFSATAFHWIKEEVGYPKIYALLKKGGAFAQFANHPYRDKGNPVLSEEIDRLYGKYYYAYHKDRVQKPQEEFGESQAKQRAETAAKYGFEDIRYHLFYRTRRFSAEEYTMLLGTYSDHIAIEESIRKEFFKEIERAIDRCGGSITIYDTMDLELARKPLR